MRFRLTVGVLVVGALAAPLSRPVAQAPVSDAAISGVVKDAKTGQPIADAIVQLGHVSASTGNAPVLQRQFTDARGRFVFANLAAGDYQIRTSRIGYVDGGFGAAGEYTSATFATIRVRAGQWFSTADVNLARPGSVTGTVTDERGEPVIGVYVRVLARIRVAGADHLAFSQVTLTDDRGMYRVGQLRPGRYVAMVPSVQTAVPADSPYADRPTVDLDPATRLVVGGFPVPPPPVNGRTMVYPIAFSGGASIARAAAVLVEPGTERGGVDIRMIPVSGSRVSGIVQGPRDVVAGLGLRLLAEGLDEVANGGEAAITTVAADGTFTFPVVPAGTYTIEAPLGFNQYAVGPLGLNVLAPFPFPPGMQPRMLITNSVPGLPGVGLSRSSFQTARKYWARTPIAVGGGDISDVVVTLRPLLTMRGQVARQIDPAFPAPPASASVYLSLESADGSVWNADAENAAPPKIDSLSTNFTIEGVVPGLFVVRSQAFGWTVKSVMVGGREHVSTPIDTSTEDLSNVVVTLTNSVQSVMGTVTTPAGDPVADAAVIVFPAEQEQWKNFGQAPARIQTVAATTSGAFRFGTLPAGDYFVLAVPASRSTAWTDADFFERMWGMATRVSIAWGETKTVALKRVEVR